MSTQASRAADPDLAVSVGERPAGPVSGVDRSTPKAAGRFASGTLVAKARGFLGRRAALDTVAAGLRPPRRFWRGFSFRTTAALGKAETAAATPVFTGEPNAQPTPAQARARAKKTWREQRWERRRKRRFTEEVLGWILVPIIVLSGYWAVKSGLNALGTSPTVLIQNIKTAISSRS